jgi:hypothetical protein
MDAESRLPATTSGFTLAAAITFLVNTALACAKDASAPLKAFMKSIAGHDWTTQGLFDLALFVVLGLIFAKTRVGESIAPARLVAILIAAVAVAGAGLALWYALT